MNHRGWWLQFRSFWIFPALAIVAITLSRRFSSDSSLVELLWLLPIGIFLWSLLEYVLHRFVFHMESDSDNLHIKHHRQPTDPALILVVPEFAILISMAIMAVLLLVTRNAFMTAGIMSGIWTGFLYYETVHYRVHVGDRTGSWISQQRHMHFHHHFRNSKRCFGVTTPIWDYVFRTTAKS